MALHATIDTLGSDFQTFKWGKKYIVVFTKELLKYSYPQCSSFIIQIVDRNKHCHCWVGIHTMILCKMFLTWLTFVRIFNVSSTFDSTILTQTTQSIEQNLVEFEID
jgi:hypothetical protein